MVGVNVVAADTDDEAARLFTSIQQRFLGMQRGQRGPLPRPIAPAAMDALWTPQEKAGVQRMLAATRGGLAGHGAAATATPSSSAPRPTS